MISIIICSINPEKFAFVSKNYKELLEGASFVPGRYRLVFGVAAYFRSRGMLLPDPPFLDEVPLDFGLATVGRHYHVPLLASPYAYSTYRGS